MNQFLLILERKMEFLLILERKMELLLELFESPNLGLTKNLTDRLTRNGVLTTIDVYRKGLDLCDISGIGPNAFTKIYV